MIRKAELRDIPRIAEIIVFGKRTAYRPIFQNDAFSFNELQVCSLAEAYTRDLSQLQHMLVYDDGILKGVINRKYSKDRIEICDFYVDPFFTGKGIGRTLIRHVIRVAGQTQIHAIFLWVIAENQKARTFYERNGFVTNGKTALIEGTNKLDMYYEQTFP
ncbi:MAG: GNAT family N-acetyltransferase [Lachnospiraceae bacterium]|nr:GNAT family N-acetyltransferase [uncultured Acetatifactor sp.]MCI8288130.1 GNAT family N-acetyltransferase [Lachnospiraceae bacterium]